MSLEDAAGGDPGRLRISDAERHSTADFLRDAAAAGRLDVDELDERLEAAYAAKTYADLLPLLADLPGADGHPVLARRESVDPPATGGSRVPATRYDSSVAVMSGQDRRGVWEVGRSHTAVALMGGVVLDLRQARFAADEVVITASAFWGGVEVYVGAHQRVSVEGIGVMGGFTENPPEVEPEPRADAPLIRVRGVAVMGGVMVTRKAEPRSRPRRRRG